MWKVIQGDEKAELIRDCQNDKYAYDDVIIVDASKHPKAMKVDEACVNEFISDDIVILVKVN